MHRAASVGVKVGKRPRSRFIATLAAVKSWMKIASMASTKPPIELRRVSEWCTVVILTQLDPCLLSKFEAAAPSGRRYCLRDHGCCVVCSPSKSPFFAFNSCTLFIRSCRRYTTFGTIGQITTTNACQFEFSFHCVKTSHNVRFVKKERTQKSEGKKIIKYFFYKQNILSFKFYH